MSLTLDPTLQAAQDGHEHEPIYRVRSADYQDAIPFQGNYFNYESSDTLAPHLITASDGRLVAVITDDGEFKVKYTGTNRDVFFVSPVSFTYGIYTAVGATIVQLGEELYGIVACTTSSTDNYHLMYATFKLDGTIVANLTVIADYTATGDWIQDSPHVIETTTGNYLVTYAKLTGGTYSIEKRTCSTWGFFSAESSLTLTGLDTSEAIDNAALIRLDGGDVFLIFDHADVVSGTNTIHNLYSMLSADNGATFSVPTARTTYTDWGSNAVQPIFAQKSDQTLWTIFVDKRNVQLLTRDDWDYSSGAYYCCRHVHFDATNDKIIMVYGNISTGSKEVDAVVKIDRTTFSVDKTWYTGSAPSINSVYTDGLGHVTYPGFLHGEGKWVVFGLEVSGACVITAIDTDEDNIIDYVLNHDEGIDTNCLSKLAGYNLFPNTPINTGATIWYDVPQTMAICVDASNDRLWVVFQNYYRQKNWLGYIDLTADPVGGDYTFSLVTVSAGTLWWTVTGSRDANRGIIQLRYISDYDYIMVVSDGYGVTDAYPGGILIVQASDGALVKEYHKDTNGSMCLRPLSINYYSDHLYGMFEYTSHVDHVDQRGLMDIDLNQDTVNYYRPGYATKDEYPFYDMVPDNKGGLWFAAWDDGVVYFDISSTGFTQYNKDTLPGIQGNEDDCGFMGIAYDEANGLVIGANCEYYLADSQHGVYMFNEDGPLRQLKYFLGQKNGSWLFGSEYDLTIPTFEYDPAATVDPDDKLWVFWTRVNYEDDEYYLMWDNDTTVFDLTDYITGPVQLKQELKRVARLTFAVASGHLFDPQNKNSTLSVSCMKGRKITLEFGEYSGGNRYFHNQGTFLIDETNMQYSRGGHPILKVLCRDLGWLWDKSEVVVTDHYSNVYPSAIIKDIVEEWGYITSDDYTIGQFEGRHTINHQWMDQTVDSMLTQILDHFFYNGMWDVDGKYTCRHVNLDKDVDHIYTSSDKIMSYSPDLSFSDFTNRVTVVGESDDFVEVLYDEEAITTLGGTVGWWGRLKDITVYYSEDQKRKARHPRLEVHQSLEEFVWIHEIFGKSGKEELSYEDPDDYYCVVTLTSPDLTNTFKILLALTLFLGALHLICWFSCGPFTFALTIVLGALLYLLASVAAYAYTVWARPVGKVKQTIQCTRNDTAMQHFIKNIVIEQKIEDPLASTVQQCCTVATGNLRLIKAQRSRIGFTKVAHLQDEITDMIQIPHPYSGEEMKVLITGITRTFERGRTMQDKIDGWRITADI